MFDLYDITKTVVVNDHLTLTVYLGDESKKMQILSFIRDEGILIQDQRSLIDVAKMDIIHTLFYVVFFVMFLIMLVTYHITRTFEFSIIALVVNTIPLAWFFSATMAFDIPISTDMLVAMIITVAVSSDATLHFIFYYYNNRLKPRTQALALERSFLYIGTPLAMGNIILTITFIAFIFVLLTQIIRVLPPTRIIPKKIPITNVEISKCDILLKYGNIENKIEFIIKEINKTICPLILSNNIPPEKEPSKIPRL